MHTLNSRNEAVLRAVLEALSEGVAAIDASCKLLFINDAMAQLLGFPNSRELPDMPLQKALRRIEARTEDGVALALQDRPLMRALRGETTTDMALHMRQPAQGRGYDVLNSAVPVRDDQGNVRMAVIRMRDVTEQRRQVQALAESEKRYRTLVENASDIVIALDQDLQVLSVNSAAHRVLGFLPEHMVGKSIGHVLDPEDVAKFRTAGTFEVTARSADPRRVVTLEARCSLAGGEGGAPMGFHVIARDVTERKLAEARQTMLLRELQHRTKNILAVVQSLVTNTLRNAETLDEANQALLGRLHAVAIAQEFVSAEGGGGAPIHTLVEGELAPYSGRVNVDGPALVVGNSFAQTFTLVIHELGTNAAKHGAFSTPDGHVKIAWSIRHTPDGEVFDLSWVERGGPPVTIPKTKGFGRRIIGLLGQPTIQYLREGLEYRVSVPAQELDT